MKNVLNTIGNAFKFVWSKLSTRIWLIVTSVLLVLTLTTNIVITQHPFLSNTLNALFGGETYSLKEGDPSQYQYFETKFKDEKDPKKAAFEAANAFNESIVEEGITLLKNENNALPIQTPKSPEAASSAPKVSIFGKNSVNLVYGGSGSSEADSSNALKLDVALKNAGFDVNPELTKFYNDDSKSGEGRPKSPNMGSILTGFPIGETPMDSYTKNNVSNSYNEYSDAAFVVISRIGGEGYDVPRTMFWNGRNYTAWNTKESSRKVIPGAEGVDSHYLQLDANEKALLNHVTANFEKVIVLVNASQSMELDPIHKDAGIDGVVWIGGPGGTGLNALGRVLNGTVNPSGRTVDTFVKDLKADPTWANFGNNNTSGGNHYTVNGTNQGKYSVDYEEGIYVGYRYYETRGKTDGDAWYDSHVTYPLGYGLSYTTFNYAITNATDLETTQLTADADSSVNVNIEVENTGTVAGKETVQLYFTAPYTQGGIEKSHVVLGGFAKTGIIQPGEKESVTINVPAYYFASYDYNDANGNGFKGYEIEKGNYTLRASFDSHNEAASVEFTQIADVRIENDPITGNKVENQFDDVAGDLTYLSRADWIGTFPKAPTAEELSVTQAFINSMEYDGIDKDKPWESHDMPTQAKRKVSRTEIQLYQLRGVDYTDPLWDEFMDQITVAEMSKLIGTGIYSTTDMQYLGKPRSISVDGPVGITAFMGDAAVYGTASYASGTCLAATYNTELAFGFGDMIAEECLVGNQAVDGQTYSSWYAPGVNIHRSAFGGRNWEYYSEDATLSGIMGGEVIRGAREKGLVTYIKHFALNDQETNRCDGVSTWANEQSMREIYLRAFEIAIKNGGSNGVMSSFNSLGTTWAGGSYALLTEVLRNEWGFVGSVITDFNLYDHMPADQMIRAGGDLNLSQYKAPTVNTKDATQVTAIRQAAKNILYSLTQSSMLNGYGEGVVYQRHLPQWVNTMFLIDLGIVATLGTWGTLVIIAAKKSSKKSNDEAEA